MFMQNNMIQVFESSEFGILEVMMIGDKPHFPATECAKALGYKDTINAIKRHCRWVAKRHLPHPQNPSKLLEVNFIPEGDLYRLIIRSKLPAAERFENWVFDEVLPTIRKHGAYIQSEILEKMQKNADFTDELLRSLSKEQAKNKVLQSCINQAIPKARYTDVVLCCPEAVQASIIAKDYGMSAITFNKLLHNLGVQYRVGKVWLLYAEYHNNGYTITNTYTRNGMVTLVHTCWTQRGRFWLYNLLKSHGVLPEVEKRGLAEQVSLYETYEAAGR
jgi:prophage antirepressor-like protein